MKRKEFALFLGLVPLSYVVLLVVGAGSRQASTGVVFAEDASDRLFQALLLSFGITLLFWYFNRSKRMESIGSTHVAMKFFADARDAYRAKGMHQEAAECDLLVGKVTFIALDPRIEVKQ